VSLVGNDVDPDGTIDPSRVNLDPAARGRQTTTTIKGQGTATVDANGVVTFTPVQGYVGTVTIQYTVTDNNGATSNQATLSIKVVPKCVLPMGYSIRKDNNNNNNNAVCTEGAGGCTLETLKSKSVVCAKGYAGFSNVGSATCPSPAQPAASVQGQSISTIQGQSFIGVFGCSVDCGYDRWSE